MRYTPSSIPASFPADVRTWLATELARVAAALDGVDNVRLEEQGAEPSRYEDGDVVYANGTDWDPGSGEGVYTREAGAWVKTGGGGGAAQLTDLTDVNTSTPTNRNALLADGVDWESRPIVEADVSDFGTYLVAADLSGYTQASVDEDITGQWDFTGDVRVRSGADLYVYNAGNTDFGKWSHDGTDLQLDLTNTQDYEISGMSGYCKIQKFAVVPTNNTSPRFYADANGLMYVGLSRAFTFLGGTGKDATWQHNGTDFVQTLGGSTNQWVFNAGGVTMSFRQGGDVEYRDGAKMRIMDGGDTDWMEFSHNSTDAILDFVNTAEFNINDVPVIFGEGSIFLVEKAAADADTAGRGQLWVKNTTPCQLWFTDDAGTDTQIV